MKKLIVPALFLVLASAPAAMAQSSILNGPAKQMPTLIGSRTEDFPAKGTGDARNICHQAATAYNQLKCVAVKNKAKTAGVQTYHCECRK